MNKKIIFPLCLIFISTLLACSDKNQDTPQIDLNSEQNVMRIEDKEKFPFAISEPKVTNDKWFEGNDSSQIDQIRVLKNGMVLMKQLMNQNVKL